METPSGHPQAGNGQGSEHLLQPQSNSHPNIVPVSNPPTLPGSLLQAPQGSSRNATITGRKQMSSNKVAIPRQRSDATPRYGRRVPLACETCRMRKTKCSGDTPICRQCLELRVECRYPVSWRERTKGQITKLSAKSDDYENLLREVSHFVDGRMSERIKSILDKYSERRSEPLSDQVSNNSTSAIDEEPDPETESLPSSIGSLSAIDRVDEDLNRSPNARATGYMGKNSEVTWLQRLGREADHRARNLPGPAEHKPDRKFAIHSVNYHLDDVDITPPGPVNLYWIPSRDIADKFFEDYLDTVHPVFPIISRPLFCAQYKNFFDNLARPGDKWLAILNLIFAISSHHAHLMQAPWRGDDRDHFVYLARARALSMNSDSLFIHPDLQQVQVEALMAFYLLATDQINRAWRIASLALRSGISLGLNLRNTSEITPDASKEARYRVWWCLYSFEHLLGIMTGRMTGVSDGICTTPMPLPVDEDRFQDPAVAELLGSLKVRHSRVESKLASYSVRQSPMDTYPGRESQDTSKNQDAWRLKSVPPSISLFFLYYIDLTVISQEIVNRVYSLDCIVIPWTQIENRIGGLQSRVDRWYSNLPEVYDWTRADEQKPEMLRASLCLAFQYYSARITLGRPCLCRRDVRSPNSPTEGKTFCHEISVVVLEAARQLVALVPDEPDASRIYQLCPWWCILHYLMQATAVLLLELSFGCIHMPEEEKNILESSKKGIRWLYAMSESSLASRRAWELCDMNLRRIAAGLNLDLDGIPAADYQSDANSGLQETQSQNTPVNPSPPVTITTTQFPTLASSTPIFHISTPDGFQQVQNPPFQGQTTAETFQQSATPLLTSPQTEYLFPFAHDTSSAGVSSDMYFPYDPITGEFIRSFFPNLDE